MPDGFIAHFYTVCEQIGPVLAWGFLGPRSSLHDLCCYFKVSLSRRRIQGGCWSHPDGLNSHVVSVLQDQVLSFLKDIFDLDKVRYSSVDSLADDMLRLLHRRSELLLAYLETDSLLHLSGCSSPQVQLMPGTLLKAGVQWESPEICSWTESRSPARPCHDLLDQRNPLRAQKNMVLIVRVWTPSHHVLQRTSCSTDLHTQQSLCRNSTSFLVNTR